MEMEHMDRAADDFPSRNTSDQRFPETACMAQCGHVIERASSSWNTVNQHLPKADDKVDAVQTLSSRESTSMEHPVEPDGKDVNGLQPICSTGRTSDKHRSETDGDEDALQPLCSIRIASSRRVFGDYGNVDALQPHHSIGSTSNQHLFEADGNFNDAQPSCYTGNTSQQYFDGVVKVLHTLCNITSTSRQHRPEFDDADVLERLCIDDTVSSHRGYVDSLELHREICLGDGIGTNDLSQPIITGNEGYCQTNEFLMNEGQKVSSEISVCIGLETCAICHKEIRVEDTAQIKGCEHFYCITCILRWATYKSDPWCPQCRRPFSSLFVYRALDGTLSDYMVEESVCLLLRTFWFKPMGIQYPEQLVDCQDDNDIYEEPQYVPNLRLGNRRWGDSGYVRAGRYEARSVAPQQDLKPNCSTSSSQQSKGKGSAKETLGRRARRTKKREQNQNR